jgi:4-diphosphocytidyl-2-C-methyl-D-erythritol kinase
MVKLLSEDAPAKINLYLRVTGRRGDGYHELDSLFVQIELCDRLFTEVCPERERTVSMRCDAPTLPVDEGNLAYRAARDFLNEFKIDAQVLIELRKRIPVGAGLGGGSSDAGAVLRMLAALCRVSDSERLAAIALKLGADVPFFLNPVAARVRGIGERIEPLGRIPEFRLVIAVPPVEVSTAQVFGALKPEQWSGPASDEDINKILHGQITAALLVNDLAQTAMAKWPVIAHLKALLEASGAQAAAMTGSGGAVFGIFSTAEAAEVAAREVAARAPQARVFATMTRQFSQ